MAARSVASSSGFAGAPQRPRHVSRKAPAARAKSGCNGRGLWHIHRMRARSKDEAIARSACKTFTGYAVNRKRERIPLRRWGGPQTDVIGGTPTSRPTRPRMRPKTPGDCLEDGAPQNVATALCRHTATPKRRHGVGSLAKRATSRYAGCTHSLQNLCPELRCRREENDNRPNPENATRRSSCYGPQGARTSMGVKSADKAEKHDGASGQEGIRKRPMRSAARNMLLTKSRDANLEQNIRLPTAGFTNKSVPRFPAAGPAPRLTKKGLRENGKRKFRRAERKHTHARPI